MNNILRNKLIAIAEKRQTKKDPSHDFQHVLRVTNLAEEICKIEKADLDIVIPASLFHDLIVYPKNTNQSKNETDESANEAVNILKKFKEYPAGKIEAVSTCIKQCSFNKKINPDLLEAKILQDADRLEATGAIAIMRTFSSGGQMNKPFYDPSDPFCENDCIDFRSGLDLFYKRLLVVEHQMHTKSAQAIAKRRTIFLNNFLKELKLELKESKIIS